MQASLGSPTSSREGVSSIGSSGDESLSTFESAVDAVWYALAIQEVVDGESDLELHIGIHPGETVFRGSEVFGDGVNIAARICVLSDGSAPCISDEVQHAVQNQANLGFESLGAHEFKQPTSRGKSATMSGSLAACCHSLDLTGRSSQPATRGPHSRGKDAA